MHFHGYKARGAPFGPDDGCIAPWAVAASLPFAPEIVLPTLKHFLDMQLNKDAYGFAATVNPSFRSKSAPHGWRSPYNYGINQGPAIMMIENFRSGLPWKLMRECAPVVRGLRRAGFEGGWLADAGDRHE